MKVIEASSIDKRAHLERLLEAGTVMVFIDSRLESVQVPEHHKGSAQLPLNLDYAFQIPDFQIFDDRIEASLSFNRKRQFCVLPFEAIYAIRSDVAGEVAFFLEDVPADLSAAQHTEPVEHFSMTSGDTKTAPPKKKPQLVAISSTNNAEDEAKGSPKKKTSKKGKSTTKKKDEPSEKKAKRPQLRLIKNED